jgi:CYTH domain-containing protein
MPKEIERKFLVDSDHFKKEAFQHQQIIQGFLNKDPRRTVRIRLREDKAYLTIKGISSADGLSRFEWEKEISPDEAKELLKLCDDNLIEKTRYLTKHYKHTFEVDEFHGRLSGLLIAEIELKTENEYFEKPEWLGKEVTGDPNYYNSNL